MRLEGYRERYGDWGGLVDLVWVVVDGFGSSPIVGVCFLGPVWFGFIQCGSFLLLKNPKIK